MKQYKYQMHAHTHPCSACSRLSPEELVESLRAGGYAGCVITNHFLHGNTGIDRRLAWEDFVAYYERDYLECRELAKKDDIDILFGVEEGVGGALEILCFGITPEFLYRNPRLASGKLSDWYRAMKGEGAVCIQAHPYRDRWYMNMAVGPRADLVDGIEVHNACNGPGEDSQALALAKKKDYIITCGGDIHSIDAPEIGCAGVVLPYRVRTSKEFADALKRRDHKYLVNRKIVDTIRDTDLY